MFASYGTGEKTSRCANSSHFIPLLIISKGHHHLPHKGIRPQMMLTLSTQNIYSAVHLFPCTGAKKLSMMATVCMFIVKESNSMALFNVKVKKKSHIATSRGYHC